MPAKRYELPNIHACCLIPAGLRYGPQSGRALSNELHCHCFTSRRPILPVSLDSISDPDPPRAPPTGAALPLFLHPQTYPNKVHIHYTVDRAEDRDSWHGSVGHISKEMLQASSAVWSGWDWQSDLPVNGVAGRGEVTGMSAPSCDCQRCHASHACRLAAAGVCIPAGRSGRRGCIQRRQPGCSQGGGGQGQEAGQ